MPGAATLSSRWRLRLLDGLLVPLLLLTGLTAYIGLNLLPAAGPLAGSELVRLPLSLALPLLVAAAALVGHALRERSAGYAYAGGCLVTLAGALWYSVAVVRTGQIFTAAHWVQLLYILVILQAGWAILWLLVRRWLPATTGADGSGQTVPWLLLQLSVPALLLTAVLVAGILALTALPDGSRLHGLVWYPPASPWTLAAGAPLGWLALASLATALFLHQRNRLAPGVPAYLGLALVMLLACSGEIRAPGWGYRTWLLGLAGFTLAWALLPWRLLRRDPDQRFITAAPWWVGVGSLLGILFSVHAALLHNDPLWAASVIASIGVAILGLGLQRSWDAVLFVGSLVLVLSSSLLVGHAQRPLPLAQWWLTLVHVDALVLLLAALLWLVLAQRRSAAVRPWWLGGQLALGVGAVLAPLAAALVLLYRHPEAPPAALLRPLGSWLGLGVFAAAVLAGGWYLARYHGRWWIHFAVAAVVLLAVQAAAVALPWDTGNWLVWHVFTVGLGLNSLLLLLACWWAAALLNAGSHFWSSDSEQRWVRRLQPLLGSRAGLQWLEVLALLPAVLSLRTALSDPLRPYWPVGLLLVSAVLWLCLLLWQRRPFQVHMLGGVLTLPAAVIWLTWGQDMVVPLLTWHVLGLGLAAIATACVEAGRPRMSDADREGPALLSAVLGPLMLPGLAVLVGGFLLLISTPGLAGWRQAPPEILRDGNILLALAIILAVVPLLLVNRRMFVSSFRHRLQEDWTFTRGACVLALHLFALLVLLLTVADGRAELPRWATGLLWPAWGSLGLTALISALDRSKRRLSYDALPLYITGLLGLSLLLYQLQLGPQRWLWSACLLLALYLLLASLVSSWAGRWLTAPVWREQPWFVPVQGIFAVVVLVLSLWLVCAFTHLADRLAGPLAVGLLIAAALVLAVSHTLRHRKPRLRYATLVLGGACLLTLLWALLNPAQAHIHLLRHILWLAAISVATLAYGPGLRQGLSRSSDWVRCGESLSRLCWLAAALSVFAVLVHEMIALGTKTAAPLPPWAIVLVAAAIVGLTASGLRFALVPADDPFALPEKRRTLYVYGAEVFLVLLMMHLRLTVPEVLPGLVSRYWPFLVLLLAFAGVGLAELCQRLRLPVLAGPLQRTGLFLPLLPLLMCWLLLLGVPLPGSAEVPLPKLLAALPRTFAGYALLWLLTSAVYALAALAHRSPRFALLAALAGNLGIWSLLYHHRDAGLGFLSHPQLWLLPLALILLVAEHLNRSRLGPVRSMSLRYFALIVLYLSSTADLFLSGLDDVGMALVLAVLAILGILAGILLRVRAFLFVGFPFLLLVIAARIWHAAVQQAQTWVWWVAVIVLGVLILILFALFEKRRQDVLRVLEEFRDWH